nr:hypothetical protein BaRGS_031974 [Batillaria attramentaria]
MTIKNPEEENAADQTQDNALTSEVSRPDAEVDTTSSKKDDFFDMDPSKGDAGAESKPADSEAQENEAGETTGTKGGDHAAAAEVQNGDAEGMNEATEQKDEAAPEPETAAEPASEPAADPAPETAAAEEASREDEYEEDFSEMSEKGDSTAAAATTTDAVVQDASAEDHRSSVSKSPTPSSKDEPRAEAGAVVPVPVPIAPSDGRSREREGGEARGEDRSEMQGDGGDNTRGTGQWKSEEEAYMESSLLKQNAEQEALQAVINDKTKLQREFDELQMCYLALEEAGKKWEEEASMLREKCQRQESRIKELEAEEARLREYEMWGKDNEAKVKDLQSRLAILAGEDAEKDRRIQKLEEDLRDTNSRLINAERQAALGAEALNQDTPKSKTCVVM